MSENNKLTTYEKLRKSVIDYRASHTIEETAKSFNTSYRTVIRWVKQYNNDNSLSCKERGGATYCIVDREGKDFLIEQLQETNDLTLEELRQKYFDRFGVLISISAIHYHLKKGVGA